MVEFLTRWLAAAPDYLQGFRPALFIDGLTLVEQKADILGGEKRRLRLNARLSCRFPGENAEAWLALQTWVQDNPPPALGQDQTAFLGKGGLKQTDGNGWLYEAALTVEFTR